MDRRKFLKSMGLMGAVVITTTSPLLLTLESKKETDIDIFFARNENNIYILFRNRDRVFKETTHASEDEYKDISKECHEDLKQLWRNPKKC